MVGQTVEMLYERQRALVRKGLLESVKGRGPGSGVRADEAALATFFISLLSHDLLVLSFVTEVFSTMKSDTGKCPVTGAKTFGDAMRRILGDEAMARKAAPLVVVNRGHPGNAYFVFSNGRASHFHHKGLFRPTAPPSAIHVSASIKPNFVEQIAGDIARFKAGDTV